MLLESMECLAHVCCGVWMLCAVVPLCGVQSLLSTVSLHEVRGLGGKLGEAVGVWAPHAKTAADLQQYSQDELVKQFGHKHGTWLYKACRYGGAGDRVVSFPC
jgi:nucleotidyltransferase/DNA polymerase involved in DNA repair